MKEIVASCVGLDAEALKQVADAVSFAALPSSRWGGLAGGEEPHVRKALPEENNRGARCGGEGQNPVHTLAHDSVYLSGPRLPSCAGRRGQGREEPA